MYHSSRQPSVKGMCLVGEPGSRVWKGVSLLCQATAFRDPNRRAAASGKDLAIQIVITSSIMVNSLYLIE